MTEPIDNIRSEAVTEILSNPPKGIIRWGTAVISAVVLMGFIFSAFIKYPDVLTAQATITNLNPPVSLLSKTNGKVTEILVKNNETVEKEQVIAVLESPVHYLDVFFVSKQLDTLQNSFLKDSLPTIHYKPSLRLGEIQSFYNLLIKSYHEFSLYKKLNPQQKEIKLLSGQLNEYKGLLETQTKQQKIYKEELDLFEKDFNRSQALFDSQTISAKEYEDKKREFLRTRGNYQTIKTTISNTLITVSNLEKNKLQLQIQEQQQTSQFKQEFEDALKNLQAIISGWTQNYLIKSPIDGKVSFFNIWANNQNVKAGDEVATVIPLLKQDVIGKVHLPVVNSGKVKMEQKVNIKLQDFPFQEYGMLTGRIKSISLMPKQNTYAIEVYLPGKLLTTYYKELPYRNEMQGSAEIITEDLSLLQRLFYQFRKLLR